MPEIRFNCPACGKALKCDAKFGGLPVKCPECDAEAIVPPLKAPADKATAKDPAGDDATKEPSASRGEESGAESKEPEARAGARPHVADEESPAGSEEEDQDEDEGEEDEGEGEEADAAIAQYLEDGQPAKAVRKAIERIAEFLKEGETVEYIAVQHNPINPLDNIEPGCVVITSRRLIICRPKLLGRVEFRGFPWYEVTNLRFAEKIGGATVAFKTISGEPVSVDLIPKKQARHLYTTAQQCDENAREERRLKTLEQQSRPHAEERPAPHAPSPPNPPHAKGEPVARLKQLKEMLDLGLITQEDYAAKKQELLAEL